MSEAQSSDAIKDLVQFLFVLAILGIILALIFYYGAGLEGPASPVP